MIRILIVTFLIMISIVIILVVLNSIKRKRIKNHNKELSDKILKSAEYIDRIQMRGISEEPKTIIPFKIYQDPKFMNFY